jgi:hypothetical protein
MPSATSRLLHERLGGVRLGSLVVTPFGIVCEFLRLLRADAESHRWYRAVPKHICVALFCFASKDIRKDVRASNWHETAYQSVLTALLLPKVFKPCEECARIRGWHIVSRYCVKLAYRNFRGKQSQQCCLEQRSITKSLICVCVDIISGECSMCVHAARQACTQARDAQCVKANFKNAI